jgi:hypothetical protein
MPDLTIDYGLGFYISRQFHSQFNQVKLHPYISMTESDTIYKLNSYSQDESAGFHLLSP